MSDPIAPPNPASPSSPWRQRITLRRIGLLVAVALAFVVLVVFTRRTSTGTGTDDLAVTSNPANERLLPDRGDEVLQQEPIGIDLAAGWEAGLTVDGTPIPRDQLAIEDGLDTVQFQVGPGKAVTELPGGEVCATARFWRASETPAEGESVSWCFNVL